MWSLDESGSAGASERRPPWSTGVCLFLETGEEPAEWSILIIVLHHDRTYLHHFTSSEIIMEVDGMTPCMAIFQILNKTVDDVSTSPGLEM